jgi:hypothetical protein
MRLDRTLFRGLVLGCVLLAFAGANARAKELKFDAILVWATNAEKSPNPNHKPVGPAVRNKLKELPLKWTNFFEVNRKSLEVPQHGSEKVALSAKCKIEVTDVDGKEIEVALIGKDQPVLRRTQPLSRGEMLVVGGNAPDETGWLVVLRRTE